MHTRRAFLLTASAALLASRLRAQSIHLNLAELDRAHIEASAKQALDRRITPVEDFASEAFLNLTLDLPALTAAILIAPTPILKAKALTLLQTHFQSTSKVPTLVTSPEAVTLLAQLAETAVALPFLNLPADVLASVKPWFTAALTSLTESRPALLARDSRAHPASAWLLSVAAFSRFTGTEAPLTEARHRYKTSTIRAQINAEGLFPNELTTPNPFRNSLFNLDLLAGVCTLLSTPFDSVWDHELQDGPGMRGAIARHLPYLAHPNTWPYAADETHFHDLPARRPAPLFAARAFNQPDYATLWRTLTPAQPTNPEILRTFPIRQPILWLPQPHRP